MGTEITGHLELVYPSQYVKAADLQGRDVTVVIEKVEYENLVMQGGRKDRKACITMLARNGRRLGKRWVVGKTVLRQIGAAIGSLIVREWKGREITMYPTTCKGKSGGMVECIRVRVHANPDATEIPDEMAKDPEPLPPEFMAEVHGEGES
ncbi:MAG: hypothetical protein IPM54_24910 [Polyangiaceae bacterium]|nr:hypothetical protein [Polyangiaceae bacterium]